MSSDNGGQEISGGVTKAVLEDQQQGARATVCIGNTPSHLVRVRGWTRIATEPREIPPGSSIDKLRASRADWKAPAL